MERIVIIGGGGTGAAIAHDLAQRGFAVELFESGALLSGTTGRHHGLLHSGARYAVHDPESARACMQENRILRKIAPEALEPTNGLFVALDDSDMQYRREFLRACRDCGIPTEEISPTIAAAVEPALADGVQAAVTVPDAVMDAWRLPMHFFATARANGARIHPFTEVTAIRTAANRIRAVGVCDHRTGRCRDVACDMVINAAGPWAGRVAALCGVDVPIRPGPGVMVAVKGRLTRHVINRLHPAGEGDIIVPQRQLTLLGTTLWLADEPDGVEPPPGHVERIVRRCAEMAPDLLARAIHSVWWATRPLVEDPAAVDAQQISRTFSCLDHRTRDGLEGFATVIGGKATTLRAMAEAAADLVCRKTGRDIPCRTRETGLLHYRLFYK